MKVTKTPPTMPTISKEDNLLPPDVVSVPFRASDSEFDLLEEVGAGSFDALLVMGGASRLIVWLVEDDSCKKGALLTARLDADTDVDVEAILRDGEPVDGTS